MATKPVVSMTFAVTIPDVRGKSIKDMRALISEALASQDPTGDLFDPAKIKISLTNKETHYGKR